MTALPGFHAFTGCDQTGTICGKSKILCWNTLKKADKQVLGAFASLGSSAQVTADVTDQLELYMCQLHVPLTQIKTVKELRWFLFSKGQYSDEKLPPTKGALEQMIKRANYVALVWKECGTPHPDLPEPTSHGWSQDRAKTSSYSHNPPSSSQGCQETNQVQLQRRLHYHELFFQKTQPKMYAHVWLL